MNEFNRTSMDARTLDTSVDAGLRSFMLGVYNKMGLGLALTAVLALAFSSVPALSSILYQTVTIGNDTYVGLTTVGAVLRWVPLGILVISMFAMRNPSPLGANVLYWGFVSTFGVGASIWFVYFNLGSIAQVFFITSAAFFALSLYGYTTKRNLQAIGSFLFMALIGLILAIVVNWFLGSSVVAMAISVIGVLIFAGLTAYDTQNLKLQYSEIAGQERAMSVATTFGALNLYINFVNMFQFLLMLLGNNE